MNIGQKIRELRKSRGMSQEELASMLGYRSYTTIQKWESGVSEPPFKVAHKLSEIFDTDLDELAGTASDSHTLPSGLIDKYFSLNDIGRSKLIERADELIQMGYTREMDLKRGHSSA